MRLIDADKLKESILLIKECWGCSPVLSDDEKAKALSNLSVAIREINEAPTAYDVDKVVEQLENKTFSAEVYNDDFNGVQIDNLLCMGDVYEIVKAGGVDE